MNLLKAPTRRRTSLVPFGGSPINRLFRNDVDQLLGRFFNEPWSFNPPIEEPFVGWAPAIDVSQTDDQIVVRAELPGLQPKDIDVRVTNNVLTISGDKSEETEEKREDSYYCERAFGSFSRSFELPVGVDGTKVLAEFNNGILTVKLPKPISAKAVQIEVKPAVRMGVDAAQAVKTPTTSNSPSQRVPVGAGR